MELQITPEYRISTDEKNVFLEKARVAKSGEKEGQIVWEELGAYPEAEWALRAAVKHKINTSDLKGVETIVTAIKQIGKEIKESLSASNLHRLDKQMRQQALEIALLKKQLNKEVTPEEGEQ